MNEQPEQQPAAAALRRYTPEEDQRILDSMQIVEEMGLPMHTIFTKLADDLERTERAIEVRVHILKKKLREAQEPSSDDDEEDESVLSKLKSIIKERDTYKRLYENGEEKVKDYDRMARELRKIRRVLGE